MHVVESAAGTDPALRDLAEEGKPPAPLRHGHARGRTRRARALRPDLTVDEAADILWLYNDPLTFHRLVLQRGWTPARYEEWIAAALTGLLLRPDYVPAN